MKKIISLHIPKTGGTSLYHQWKQTFQNVSPSFRRRDVKDLFQQDNWKEHLLQFDVIHGHFHFREIRELTEEHDVFLVAFIRDAVDRVISNYHFFMEGLLNPERNPRQYELNKHRIGETLMEYAEKADNRNRMTEFLGKEGVDACHFIGRLESIETDIQYLGTALECAFGPMKKLNIGGSGGPIGEVDRKRLEQLNDQDCRLIDYALKRREAILRNLEKGDI